MFPDSSERVNLRFLPFLKDLTEPTIHAWGASVLAYLYSTMSDFVQFQLKDKLMKNLSGCVTLIQVWSYEHFPIGRPVSRISSDTRLSDSFTVDYRCCRSRTLCPVGCPDISGPI
ncbi:uncharacterized protein M6B38_353720 [Iris pallida]|uniref:Aminotransferase-like plant mobile domain-containing protein n=1 Tax=Iris pallida TaxID=29817 RepID=A0AAX6GPQ2_IRIPA|nr:uncharacterized protein M6B38_353720 [Iris pallida]